MFNETKSLIVVYKDEMLLNELRKLVETKDDTAEGVVGVKDGSVKIVSWNEKMWLGQKKNGTINNKVLFIGDIKKTDQLIPILDVKFDKYGVMYGWAGNQAVLTCDPKKLGSAEYQEFLKDIENLDMPEAIKKANRIEEADEIEEIKEEEETEEESSVDAAEKQAEEGKKVPAFLKNMKKAAEVGVGKIGEAFEVASKNTEEFKRSITKDRAAMRRQLLFYGIINLYSNDLEKFLNS